MVIDPSELAFPLGFLLVIASLSGVITDALRSGREIGAWFRVRLHPGALLWAGVYSCLLAPVMLGNHLPLPDWSRFVIVGLVGGNGVVTGFLSRGPGSGASREDPS